MAGRKNKKKKGSVLLWIIFAVARAVFLYAGYRLFGIMRGYHKSTEEYKSIEAEYTTPRTPSGEASAEGSGDGAEEYLQWIRTDEPRTIFPDFFRTELQHPSPHVKVFLDDGRPRLISED